MIGVVGSGAMHRAAVVPHNDVAQCPDVLVNAPRLAGIVQQLVARRLRRLVSHARNAVGVTPGVERFAMSLRMRLHDGPQRRALIDQVR